MPATFLHIEHPFNLDATGNAAMQILKFVLWTWPSATASAADFLDSRVKFHQVLAHEKVDGFLGSAVFKVDSAPWAGAFLFENSPWSTGHKTVFEEWYLFHGSAALDAVNERVHTGPYKESHGKFLRQDLGGECAGLYYVRKGELESALSGTGTDCTLWFNKAYATYDDLLERLAPTMRSTGSVLWRRLLVLGPTPEFHLDVDASVSLPEDLTPYRVRRSRVWRRLLVLGPTPEFHLDVDASVRLPEDLKPYRVRRSRAWPM